MKNKPKVVFDTNIYISAILFGGNPRNCLDLAKEGRIELFSSNAILLELASKLSLKFYWETEAIEKTLKALGAFSILVSPKEKITIIKNDPSDNRILECAKTAKAEIIVSGDKKHLLSLKYFQKIPIVSASDLLRKFVLS